jgi:hypothetical protein
LTIVDDVVRVVVDAAGDGDATGVVGGDVDVGLGRLREFSVVSATSIFTDSPA